MPTPPAANLVALLRAGWRMACLGGLIAEGVFIVRRRLPALDEAARHAQVQRWARRVLRVLGVQVQLQGSLAPQARMLVANHVSWLDVMALQSVVPQARFVAKVEVRHWPLVGALVTGAGSLFVDRQRPRQARESMQQITAVMHGGGLVAVFPEGTTSDGRQVLPFRAGLLQAATQAGCAVQPVALRYRDAGRTVSDSVPYIGDDSLLQSFWRLCRARGVSATLTMLPTRDALGADRRALAHGLHADVRDALGLARATSDLS